MAWYDLPAAYDMLISQGRRLDILGFGHARAVFYNIKRLYAYSETHERSYDGPI